MKSLNNSLVSLGLSATEATLYMTGLELGPSDAATLTTHTSLKRPTVYHALATLMQKGLATKHKRSGGLAFAMSDPLHIERLLDERIAMLHAQKNGLGTIMAELSALQHKSAHETEVAYYPGKEGIKSLMEEAFYCKSRHWDIVAPRENIFYDLERDYCDYYLETRKKRQITARTLWEHVPPSGKHILTNDERNQRRPRYLPDALTGKFTSILILFDDVAAFITSRDEFSAIKISSPSVVSVQRAMFEGLYELSIPYGDVVETRKDATKNPL
jgi:predicted transcriptional regulator